MAGSMSAARTRLGVWGTRAVQSRGFAWNKSDDHPGSAGSIREAGGAFGKQEKAEEDRYFRAKSKEQLAALRRHDEEEIERHKHKIKSLEDDD